MRIDVLSLFPELIENYMNTSVLGIARERKIYDLYTHNFRDFSKDKHKCVDDLPYGGGAGMLLMPQPIFDCLDQFSNYSLIVTSPSGQIFHQELALELSQQEHLVFVCGRYEGFDQRIIDKANYNISLGNFVLSSGELAVLSIIDASLRLIPGVLGDAQSLEWESFEQLDIDSLFSKYKVSKKEIQSLLDETGLKNLAELKKLKLIEYPQYTRPAEYRGEAVPAILESGDHKKIFLWRLRKSIKLSLGL